jgi:hypothetical protein
MEARIWIEAEHLAEDVDDFCNIAVYLSTGERYALNVWTFDFFTMAQADGEINASPAVKHLYMHPPDLFVQDLGRPTVEKVVIDMLERGRIPARCLMPDDAPDVDDTLRFDS